MGPALRRRAGSPPGRQVRGGTPGSVRSPGTRTLTWADFRGDAADDDGIALSSADCSDRLRLKVVGRASSTDARERPEAARALVVPGDRGLVEQIVTVTAVAHDRNRQQHTAPRHTLAELHSRGSA